MVQRRASSSVVMWLYILVDRCWCVHRGADKSLARPGRKQANVSLRMAWISFGSLPCRKKKNLMTACVSMLLKSCVSLTCFQACFLPGRAKDISVPQYVVLFGSRLLSNSAKYTHQQGPTNICSHITTELITHWCNIIGYFNKSNFSKHK